MFYGLPYQGGKSSIAEFISSALPSADVFVDLFFGGGSITHRMLLEGRFATIIANDQNRLSIGLFSDCISGKVPSPRWVSHEEFDSVKTEDAYAACCFSFGTDWHSYLYSSDIEIHKQALHLAVVNSDFSLSRNLGYDLSFLGYSKDISVRLSLLRKAIADRRGEMPHLERLQNVERLAHLERLQNVERKRTKLILRTGDYRSLPIPDNAVVYCDPPYIGTKSYRGIKFDHKEFYDWCRSQKALVIISEYTMPDDFVWIKSVKRVDSQGVGVRHSVTEKIFVHKSRFDEYQSRMNLLF